MGEEIKTYFFDSYAFFEIIHGNKNYEKYTKDIAIITTRLNLMELHYGLLLTLGKEKADEYYDYYVKFTVEISNDIIKLANYFKKVMKTRNVSYIDSIGYVLAKSKNVKFLTGDKEFKDLDNVEFVK
ncbi:MAG: PIN domain-containing protein [Nanoarchaeota archaeon]